MNKYAPRLGEIFTHFEPPNRHVDTTFIHCSASNNSDVNAEEVHQWHLDNGWSSIGYHFFIKTDGTIEFGRDLERIPAAQGNYNTGSIAICVNGLDERVFNELQFLSLYELCKSINKAYFDKMIFRGHCEVSSKACPVFNYKDVLDLDERGMML